MRRIKRKVSDEKAVFVKYVCHKRLFFGRNDGKAEALVLWLPPAKS